MINLRALAASVFGVALLAGSLHGQELLVGRPIGAQSPAQYRNFTLRSSLATVAAAAGVDVATASTLHQRPAVLQDLEWRPSRWIAGTTDSSTDPVEQIVFSFYNDQLFRIVVDYARDRTEGLTDADVVESISSVYGTPGKRVASVSLVASPVEAESGAPVARWGDERNTIGLYRASIYGDGLRLIVTATDLERLARKATADAVRLDTQDAPRLEVARQKQADDAGRVLAAKARVANKGAFRP